MLKVSTRHWWKSTICVQGSTFDLFRCFLFYSSEFKADAAILNFASNSGTNCIRECPLNSCEAGQHCRLVRGTPVCGVVGIIRLGDEILQQQQGDEILGGGDEILSQEDEHLHDWWANYLLQRPTQSNKPTDAKKHNSGGPFEATSENHIPKKRNPSKEASSKVLPCLPSSCAPGLRCRMVRGTPVCFETLPITIGLRKTNNE